MGMETRVPLRNPPPTWAAAQQILAARGHTFQICMIDGQLSFPDELPPESWSELRFRTPNGMITVRREANELVIVTWGNADSKLLEQRDALAAAFRDAE